ncbi:MAG: disA [Firmicutes bacterium]|nr:disA [Bacillota bacterium]
MTTVKERQLWDSRFVKAIKTLAVGAPFREGLENILRAKMGALILVGSSPQSLSVVDGGFPVQCEYSPSSLYELAKMDGAIVLSGDLKQILFANAQLVPDANIFTSETGTRHRTAERVARQTGAMVIAISQRRNIISLYLGSLHYTLKDVSTILNSSNQAVQTLERYNNVLHKELNTLSALEFENLVTLGDLANVIIRAEHVARISQQIDHYIIELGTEGHLIRMQMAEIMSNVDNVQLLIKDYCSVSETKTCDLIREQLRALPVENLEPYAVCRLLGYGVTPNVIDVPVVPRGYRLLLQVRRLPLVVMDKLVEKFQTLPKLITATLEELDAVEGIGEIRSKMIKDGLKRVRAQVFLDDAI